MPLVISAKSYTIELLENATLSPKASENFKKIMSKSEVIWGDIADVNIEKLIGADTLYCILDSNPIELFMKYNSNDSNYHYAHFESFDEDAMAYVSILENNIHIDLRTSYGMYRFFSISESEVAIVRFEPQIPNESEYSEFSDDDMLQNVENMFIMPRTTPVIRVLFFYTPAVLSMMSYPQLTAIKNEAYRYINEGNESFVNSGINARLQLAYIGSTDYDESSYSWENVLKHFSSSNDSYMNEVHTLRDKYSADICVLMLNKEVNLCGQAKAIKATAQTAFCIIWPSYTYCGWRYSAIHEIGHLIGCRHNRNIDNSNTPYKYGHGYINCSETNAWSTIMSYENSCSIPNIRILNWSNPDVYHNGVATGTITYENNARVWNERAGTVSAFKNMANTIIYTATDNNTQALFESIEATTQITTGGGYEVQSGQTVEMRAPTICLTANTHISSGSTFKASAKTDLNTNPYPQFERNKGSDTHPNELSPSTATCGNNQSATKIIRDGQLLIRHGDKTYNAQGATVK